jgi:hypothetical protein
LTNAITLSTLSIGWGSTGPSTDFEAIVKVEVPFVIQPKSSLGMLFHMFVMSDTETCPDACKESFVMPVSGILNPPKPEVSMEIFNNAFAGSP